MTRSPLRLAICMLLLVVIGGLGLFGCRGDDRGASADLGPPDQTYTTRGRIHDLPDPSRPASGLSVTHEAIDDFIDRDGEVVGMDAMTMPLTPARDLSLEGFEVGDIVQLTFEVRWQPRPSTRVIEMRKLPAGTELEFRAAQPPQS